MTTASGFWAESSAGNEEFEEVNMNRTLLQTDTYANLQTILDKEGMLGYDTTHNRFLMVEGGVIVVIQNIITTTETALPVFTATHANTLYYTTDDHILRYIDSGGTSYIIGYGDVSSANTNITDVSGTASSYGSGTTLALENHRHAHNTTAHETSGTAEIDGDKIDIDFNPVNYTPTSSPSEVDNIDNLSAHLAGINNKIRDIENAGTGDVNVQADWNETNSSNDAFIHNKPTLAPSNAEQNVQADWTATNGDGRILNKPAIPSSTPAAQSSNRIYNLQVDTSGDTSWIIDSGERNVQADWNATSGDAFIKNKPGGATTSASGLLSSSDKAKLDDIDSGAEANVQSDWNATSGDAQILNKPSNATTSVAGLMSAADKTKLNSLPADAEANVQSDWNATSGDALILNKPGTATTSATGLMSSEDKTKLDGIEANAEVHAHFDWSETDSASDDFIANKPTLSPKIFFQNTIPSSADSGDLFIPTENIAIPNATDETITLDSENTDSRALVIHSNKFYLFDNDDHVYVYNSSGVRQTSDEFDVHSDNENIRGATVYNNKFYVVDQTDDKVYVYTISGTNQPSNEFNLSSDNSSPRGIDFYDNKFWVFDVLDRALYSYNTSGTYQSTLVLDALGTAGFVYTSNDIVIYNRKIYKPRITNFCEVWDFNGNREQYGFNGLNGIGSIDISNNRIYITNSTEIDVFELNGQHLDGNQEYQTNSIYKYDGTSWNFETDLFGVL